MKHFTFPDRGVLGEIRREYVRLLITALFLILPMAPKASAQDFALSSNLVDYVALGTLNADVSYSMSRHWSVFTGVRYNPFSYEGRDGDYQLRQRSVSAGARYWPWHSYSGWWMAGHARYQEYNSGGVLADETTEGDRYGIGMSGGYSLMLSPHLNLDFGLGVWAGRDSYTTYACPRCGRITGSGLRNFVLPDDFLVALTFIF